ncbi:unnamed protein product [Echinostoma caproni]|uniref:Uncharacterized protein n=1 Tax=Echinostoma caproni TaxID=27848 RepID=A0A3P8IFK4_9TREM|nr:unnamed protein product [Echinostoma caproni]
MASKRHPCDYFVPHQTDLESGDYVLEAGAKRNFEALKTAEELEAKRQAEEEEELANNPMKLLEKRTDQSKQEMEMVEVIEDLKQLNKRQAGMEADHVLLRKLWQEQETQKKAEEEADEALIKEILSARAAVSERPDTVLSEVLEDRTVVIEPTVPELKTRSTATMPKPSTSSYLKRQLFGAVCVKKASAVKPNTMNKPLILVSSSSSNSSTPSTRTQDLSQVKRTKLDDSETTTEENRISILPGMTYSDHTDSD